MTNLIITMHGNLYSSALGNLSMAERYQENNYSVVYSDNLT